ncbi:MAG: DUF4838 domain-containing protein [Treponema sp.]|jgi:hypothetical protein|nr:DUF4838 domain-containing protein [Treponema sp.]
MKLLHFDVSKEWVIHIPIGMPVVKKSAEDLSHYMKLLSNRAGLSIKPPRIQAGDTVPDQRAPRIFLLSEGNSQEQTGFFWHIEQNRIEIFGESDRGLCNGVFDFLTALGFRWPEPDQEILPPVNRLKPQEYLPQETYRYHHAEGHTIRRRLLFARNHPSATWKSVILWAVRNQIDTLVFSLYVRRLLKEKRQPETAHPLVQLGHKIARCYHSGKEVFDLAEKYALAIERGGWDLSLLVPRGYFWFNREIFRMDSGKRNNQNNFCPTSPDTLNLIRRKAEKIFRACPNTLVYHLWPDQGYERAWCSCPTCRAFTLEEQGRIAVNAAADALARINPKGRISFYERSSGRGDIVLRPNLFKVSHLPGEVGAETEGWFSTTRFTKPTVTSRLQRLKPRTKTLRPWP